MSSETHYTRDQKKTEKIFYLGKVPERPAGETVETCQEPCTCLTQRNEQDNEQENVYDKAVDDCDLSLSKGTHSEGTNSST